MEQKEVKLTMYYFYLILLSLLLDHNDIDPDELHRLFYVAVTRAKKALHILEPRNYDRAYMTVRFHEHIKGDKAEYIAAMWLWDQGYLVCRNMSQQGAVDLNCNQRTRSYTDRC